MWKLAWAEWQYQYLIWPLPFAAAFAFWGLFWRHTDVAQGSFWISLVLLSLGPYMGSLCISWLNFEREKRLQLWRSINLSGSHLGQARLLATLVPWGLSVLMAFCAVWPALHNIRREQEYDPLGLLFAWSGECLFIAVFLLWIGQTSRGHMMLAVAALIFNLHFLIDPVLVLSARASGAEPYLLNQAIHQAQLSYSGGLVFYALVALFAGLYLHRFSARHQQGTTPL
jgi:hypothetical protein